MSEEVLSPRAIQKIWDKAVYISDLDLSFEENLEEVKSVVCEFFSTHPDTKKPISIGGCAGCKKCSAEHVKGCLDNYLRGIYDHPMTQWAPEFEDPTERNKVSSGDRTLGLACNTCHISGRCPKFKENSLCGIDWEGEDVSDLSNKDILDKMVALQYRRINRETLFEEINGGKANPTVSTEIDRLSGLVAHRNNLDVRKARLTIEATESNGDSTNNNNTGSLLSKLFGGGSSNEPKELPKAYDNAVDITDLQRTDAPVKVPIREEKQEAPKGRRKPRAED